MGKQTSTTSTPSKSTTTTPIKASSSLRDKYLEFQKSSPAARNTNKVTKVTICKIRDEEHRLVAASVHNFYGAKDYLENQLPLAQQVFYYSNILKYIASKNVATEDDIAYLLKSPKIPTNLISIFPTVENAEPVNDMDEILQKFIAEFEIDPVNECPVKFEYDNDFILDTSDKIEAFFFITTKIPLPQRLQKND